MKSRLLLIIIILLGFTLRVVQVGSIPAILNRDEAALAYNALLLKETGRDEWGRHWPLALESFGDYKLPGYPLILIGSFSLFGYNDTAVRMQSVIAGTILILLGYFFVKNIFHLREEVALLTALSIALTPVFFFYSRIAFEANVALDLFIGSIYLLLDSVGPQALRKDLLSILLLFIAIFTYNTPLLLLPFVLPAIIYIRGWKNWRNWGVATVGLLLVMVIGFGSLLSLTKQKSGITIFSDELTWQQSVTYHQQFSGITQKVLGNRVVFFGRIIVWHYIQTFLPTFMVLHGGPHPWHQLPGFGHFYWCVYLCGLLGILVSIKKSRHSKLFAVLVYLLLLAPLPAAITVDAPHATRSLFFFFLFLVTAMIGLQTFLDRFANKKVLILTLFVVILSIESAHYLGTYFANYESQSTRILRGGFDQTVQDVESHASHKHIAVIDDGGYQYILTAWYLKIKPDVFFATINRHLPDKIGFTYGYKVDKYRFIKSPNDKAGNEQVLISWDEGDGKWEVKE